MRLYDMRMGIRRDVKLVGVEDVEWQLIRLDRGE
jgi:hypothetical protein